MFNRPKHAVCLLAFSGDTILTATRRGTDILALPGGKVDPGESDLEAIVRETKEETGITLDPAKLFPIYSQVVPAGPNGNQYYSTAFCYAENLEYAAPWTVEEGITCAYRTVYDLLTLGTFVRYNVEALKNLNRVSDIKIETAYL